MNDHSVFMQTVIVTILCYYEANIVTQKISTERRIKTTLVVFSTFYDMTFINVNTFLNLKLPTTRNTQRIMFFP